MICATGMAQVRVALSSDACVRVVARASGGAGRIVVYGVVAERGLGLRSTPLGLDDDFARL